MWKAPIWRWEEQPSLSVTDGFTGNVVLKTAEGTAKMVFGFMMEAVSAPEYAAALQTLAPAVMELREKLNPERAGGAHLLGIDGVVVITHGSSSRRGAW